MYQNNTLPKKLFKNRQRLAASSKQKKPPGLHREEQLKHIIGLSLQSREFFNRAFYHLKMS
jgi:hypothetical protein